jgi:hypothetical protein
MDRSRDGDKVLIIPLDLVGAIIALLSATLVLISINNIYQKKKAEEQFLAMLSCALKNSYENLRSGGTNEEELKKIVKLYKLINDIDDYIKTSPIVELDLNNYDTIDLLHSLDVAFKNMDAASKMQIMEALHQPSTAGQRSYIIKLLEKVVKKYNQDDEINKSKVWLGKAMAGKWDGTARWNLTDKTWKGLGIWKGGVIAGTWTAKGRWEQKGSNYGDFKGAGELVSNIEDSEQLCLQDQPTASVLDFKRF